jgi:biopolymer transport protein ExbD
MDEKEFDYINMIPFIDVMLVLLTIVVMTSTFVAGGVIPVELPKATGKQEKAMKSHIVEIDRWGRIYLQGVDVGLAGLREKIGAIPKETPVLIRADRALPLQAFVEVLDAVKSSGFRRVSLQTEDLAKK